MTASASERARVAARAQEGDVVLAAGAGTGKTHTLVDVFVHLVAGATALGRRVPPARILALTFGEKAAAELRGRVRSRFEELALAPAADAALVAACSERAVPVPDAAEWRAAAAAVASAPVATFHSFAAAVLRRHAAGAGLDPAFVLLDEHQASALRRAAAEATVLAALDAADVQALVRELDFSKGDESRGRGLVEHILDVAARLDEEGAGAAELHGRCDDLHEAAAAHARAVGAYRAAFDALYAALWNDKRPIKGVGGQKAMWMRSRQTHVYAALAAIPPSLDPALEPTLAEADREICSGNYGGGEIKPSRDVLKQAAAELAEAHASHVAASLAATFVRLLGQAGEAYEREKQRLAALDFADLLRRTRDLLRESPGARAETQARFDALMVDEFQDTNPLQKQLLDLCRAPGVHRLVVGDPKQSIYEFRGADMTVFGDVAVETGGRGGRVLALTESRRGRAPLVELVNRLFARVMSGGAHAFEIAFEPERDALAPVRLCPDAEEAPGAPAVQVIDVDDKDDEPAAVASLVRRFVDEGRRVWHRGADGGPETSAPARWRDVAILLRRFTRLDEFLRELRRVGVPHYVVGGRGFYEQQEIRDLCHALTLVDEPDDALAFLGVLRSPLVGVSDRTLLTLTDALPSRSSGKKAKLTLRPLLSGDYRPPADLPADEATRLADYLALYKRLRRHADRLGVAGLMRAIVGASDLPAVLAATPYGEQQIANLEQLLGQAAAHDAAGLSRATFVRALKAQVERERSLAPPAQVLGEHDDVVRVMTVHQSKGLEFPVVVVPECGVLEKDASPQVVYDRAAGLGVKVRNADGELVPSSRAHRGLDLRKARGRAESLRLFYVACTRARDHLVLAGSALRGRGTWRHHLDEWLESDPLAAELAGRVAGDQAPAAAVTPSPAELEPAMLAGTALPPGTLPAELEAMVATLAERLGPPRGVARTMVAPVTELSDFDDCARRYRLRHEVGLAEHRTSLKVIQPARGGAAVAASIDEVLDPGGLDALERGTLAHRLLERVELVDYAARGEAALDELLVREGHVAPLGADARDVRDAVRRLLDAPLGRALAARAPGSFAREESFVFAPRAAAGASARTRLLLKGQIDLVLFDDDGVIVLDYKLSRSTAPHANDYRFQLGAYAAAARALFGRPVRAGLVHLRDRVPEPRLASFDDAELDAIEARLAAIAAELAEARRVGRFPGRELATCVALECGYRSRCHAPSAAPPRPPSSTPPPASAGGKGAKRQLRLGDGVEGW
jgi:ATP-dependent helicase/nuclease subunit A